MVDKPKVANVPITANQFKKLKAKYLKDESYYPSYANGAIASISGKAEITIHFYCESAEIPATQVFELIEGKMGRELLNERMPKPFDNGTISIVRKVTSGVILSLQEAKQIHKILGEQIALIQNNLEAQKDITK